MMLVPELLPGDRCKTEPGGRNAEVRFVGKVPGMRGFWVGVQYDEKVGKNDGVLNGKRYFRCPAGHGGFIRGTKVSKIRSYAAEPGSGEAAGLLEYGMGADAAPSTPHRPPRTSLNLDGAVGGAGDADADGPISRGPFSSPRTMRGRHSVRASLEAWHRDVAPTRPADSATPDATYALGPGLEKAVVGSLSQFTILVHDKEGNRCERGGGDDIKVNIRGRGAMEHSQPGLLRTKIIDRSDGTYMCEYQPWLTGLFTVWITLDGVNIQGSPYEMEVINLRPDPARCVLRGNALTSAIARTPMKFEVMFVDGMGHPAQAEDLDVYVVAKDDGGEEGGASLVGKAIHRAVEAVEGVVSEAVCAVGEAVQGAVDAVEEVTGIDLDGNGSVSGGAAGAAGAAAGGSAGNPTPSGKRSLEGGGRTRSPRTRSPRTRSPIGRYGSPRRPGQSPRRDQTPRRDPSGYVQLDAPTRQRHLQLWASRQTADRLLAKAKAKDGDSAPSGKQKLISLARSPTSFSHEMKVDPHGFAFGGVDPGTLHAHGKLVKVHAVHYSIGLAGKYKLHIGLRQQMLPLPGSPFDLLVEPGSAYAASSRIPAESLPLAGIANEEWQHGLNFRTADMLGNVCTKGGADISMKLSKSFERDVGASDGAGEKVDCKVLDKGDGWYELKWRSLRAGVYPIDVLMDGAHVSGSPTELMVRSAEPAVGQMAVSGLGVQSAVAGIEAVLNVRVADRFGNAFEAGAQHFPYTFGCLLNPVLAGGVGDKADKKSKAAKGTTSGDGAKGATRGLDEKKAPSLPFEGSWNGNVFEMRYVAQEAGAMELHLWAATAASKAAGGGGVEGGDGEIVTGGGERGRRESNAAALAEAAAGGAAAAGGVTAPAEHRVPLPGSPFTVHVSEGQASAVGSFVGEAEAGKQGSVGFIAGENVILRPQVRDPFGNASTAPELSMTAEHNYPINEKNVDTYEELPPPKLKGGLGSYELIVEPTRAGVHSIHIKLNGQDITGSPVSFTVAPAAPSSSKCKLTRVVPHEDEPLWEKSPIAIKVTLFDKYSNQLDHGGVRVDAKASGVGVSGAKVEDNKDGTYTISLTAGPPGEIKVTIRIDGNDLPPYALNVQRNPEAHNADTGATGSTQGAASKEADRPDTPTLQQPPPPPTGKEAAEAAARKGAAPDISDATGGTSATKGAGSAPAEAMGSDGGKGTVAEKPPASPSGLRPPSPDADGAAGTQPEKLPEVPWMSAESLTADANDLIAQAVVLEAQAAEVRNTFELKLGGAILEKLGAVGRVEDMVRDWDKNGDEEISKIEFRQCVTGTDKKSLGMKVENAVIDAYFEVLDADGGGTLELAEMKSALKLLQKRSHAADREKAKILENAEALRANAARLNKVAAVTLESETADARVKEIEDNQSVEAKLGAALQKRNMKVGEVVQKWDKDGDASISKAEFRKNVEEMGIKATNSKVKNEIENLFDSIDTDRGGELDIEEIKTLFKRLLESAIAAQAELKELYRTRDKLRKAAAKQHSQVAAQREREKKEAEEAAIAAAKAEEERLARVAEEKEKARLAREAKKKAIEEEKARKEEAGRARAKASMERLQGQGSS